MASDMRQTLGMDVVGVDAIKALISVLDKYNASVDKVTKVEQKQTAAGKAQITTIEAMVDRITKLQLKMERLASGQLTVTPKLTQKPFDFAALEKKMAQQRIAGTKAANVEYRAAVSAYMKQMEANVKAHGERLVAERRERAERIKEIAQRQAEWEKYQAAIAQREVEARAYQASEREAAEQNLRDIQFEREIKQVQQTKSRSVAAYKQQRQHLMQLSGAYDRVSRSANKATQEMVLSWKSIIRLVEVQILHRIFAALAMQLRETTRAAMEFNLAIGEIQTISPEASIGAWTSELRILSDTYGNALSDVAEGAYQALSNQIMQSIDDTSFLREEIKLAATAVGTLEQAVNATTSVLNAFGMEQSRAASVNAVLFKTIELGRIRLEEMAESLGRVNVMSSQLGITFEEQQAAFATLTIQGVKFNVAQTLLTNVLLKLTKPTERMLELFRQWGVESGEMAIKTYGFAEVLRKFETEVNSSTDSMEELGEQWGRLRAITGAAGLIFNAELFEQNLAEMRNAAESFDTAFSKIMENPAKKMEIELTKIKNLFLTGYGNAIINFGNSAAETFGGLSNVVKFSITTFRDLIITMGLLKGVLQPSIGLWQKYQANLKLTNAQIARTGFQMTALQAKARALRLTLHGLSSTALPVLAFAVVALADHWLTSFSRMQDSVRDFATELRSETDEFLEYLTRKLELNTKANIEAFDEITQGYLRFAATLRGEFSNLYDAQVSIAEDAVRDIERRYKAHIKSIKDEIKGIEDSWNATQNALKTTEEFIQEQLNKNIAKDPAQFAKRTAEAFKTGDVDQGRALLEARRDLLQAELKKAEKAQAALKAAIDRGHDQGTPLVGYDGKPIWKAREDAENRILRIKRELQNLQDAEIRGHNIAHDVLKERAEREQQLIEERKTALTDYEAQLQKLKDLDFDENVDLEEYQRQLEAVNQAAQRAGIDASAETRAVQEKLEAAREYQQVIRETAETQKALTELAEQHKRVEENREQAELAYQKQVRKASDANKALLETLKQQYSPVQVVDYGAGKVGTHDPLGERRAAAEQLQAIQVELDAILKDEKITNDERARANQLLRERIELTRQLAPGLHVGVVDEQGPKTNEQFLTEQERALDLFNKSVESLNAALNQAAQNEAARQKAQADLARLERGNPEIAEKARLQAQRDFTTFQERAATAFEIMIPELGRAAQYFKSIADAGGVPHLAKGGLVRGPGGVDRIPAMLSAGEYVWDAKTTKAFYPLIRAMHLGSGQSQATSAVNYGGFNVTVHDSGTPSLTARAVVQHIKREMRKGTVTL